MRVHITEQYADADVVEAAAVVRHNEDLHCMLGVLLAVWCSFVRRLLLAEGRNW